MRPALSSWLGLEEGHMGQGRCPASRAAHDRPGRVGPWGIRQGTGAWGWVHFPHVPPLGPQPLTGQR